jgi:tetratricopeptide (TPR) repeat protein
MSVQVQKQIKDNSTDVREYFTDLQRWSDQQSKEEKRRKVRQQAKAGLVSASSPPPAVAKTPPAPVAAPEAKAKEQRSNDSEVKDASIERDKLPMPQYYNQWDQYDVDQELEKIEDEAFQQQRAEREARELEKDSILDAMAINGEGERTRTSVAKKRVKIEVRRSGRRASPVDLALPKKEEANRYFADGRYTDAVKTYSSAIDVLEKYEPKATDAEQSATNGELPHTADSPDNSRFGDSNSEETQAYELKVTLLSNRAQAFLKLEEWREAANDCFAALRFDPSHHKSILRRGFAWAKMKRWSLAAKDLQKAVATDPSDKKAQAELQMVRRMLDQQLKDHRARAKALLCDPTRDITMPTRQLRVQRPGASATASLDIDGPALAKTANGASGMPDSGSAVPSSRVVVPASGDGVSSVQKEKPAAYVPRSVRMRGGNAATASAVAGKRPSKGVGDAASGSNASPHMNFYTFEAQWTRFRNKPQERLGLLRKLGARGLPALLRESLDSELLSSIVEVLSVSYRAAPNDADVTFAVDVLKALAGTPRFDLSIRGLSSSERIDCSELLNWLDATDKNAGGDGYETLRTAYAPPVREKHVEDVSDEDDVAEEEYRSQPAERRGPKDEREPIISEAVSTSLDTSATEPPAIEPIDGGSWAIVQPVGFSLDGCD